MNQGRLHTRRVTALLGLVAFLAPPPPTARAADTPQGLKLTWAEPDHPSGIYYVKEEGTLTVAVDNASAAAAELAGEILFGSRTADEFKILTVTPITTATVGAGQRAKIPLKLAFGAAGSYELRWKHGEETLPIAADMTLECIFAPRTAKAPGAAAAEEAPWVTALPRAAVRHPGYLTDYVQRTTVRRFIIDERFSFDPVKNVGLGFGAATGAGVKEIDALLAEAAKIKAGLILRVTVPVAGADAKSLAAFRAYVTDAIRRAKGALAALAIVPGPEAGAGTDAQRRNFTAYYLAGYEAAKRADKNVALLGAGSAAATMQWLLTADPKLAAYVDAAAIGDASGEPALARRFLGPGGAKKALYLLPPMAGGTWAPSAAGLAAGATLVPAPSPDVDHGVTAHLLGGTVLLQRLQVTVPTANPTAPESTKIPFVAVFQGDGYAVAAVAGFSAGTDLDAEFPGLAHARTQVEPMKADDLPAYPNLQVGDDTHTMRVVDAAGAPVECRVGDNLFVPAAENVVYLLQGGTAVELAGSLRVATGNRLPLFEVGVTAGAEGLTIRLHNIATRELGGTVRLSRPPASAGQATEVVAEKDFAGLGPDKSLELPVTVPEETRGRWTGPVVVEVTTAGGKAVVQRTAVSIAQNP